jgi:hypothetical protein
MFAPICNPIRISIFFALMAGALLPGPQKSSLGTYTVEAQDLQFARFGITEMKESQNRKPASAFLQMCLRPVLVEI